jgi:hypothetical protein
MREVLFQNHQTRKISPRKKRPFSEQVLKNLIQTDEDIMKIAEDAVGKLSGIWKRVEHGIPLEGYCEFCPHKKLMIKNEEYRHAPPSNTCVTEPASESKGKELQKRGRRVLVRPGH